MFLWYHPAPDTDDDVAIIAVYCFQYLAMMMMTTSLIGVTTRPQMMMSPRESSNGASSVAVFEAVTKVKSFHYFRWTIVRG